MINMIMISSTGMKGGLVEVSIASIRVMSIIETGRSSIGKLI